MDRDLLVRNVWAIALRAVLASAFGAWMLSARIMPVPAFVIAYGMYSVVDGMFATFAALQRRRPNEAPRWAYVLVGSSSLGLGLVSLLWTGMPVALLVYLLAAAAVVSGLAQLLSALRLRRQVQGEWWLPLGGLFAVAFGITSVALPVGPVTLAQWVGGYRFLDGAILAALALRLRSWERRALEQLAARAVDEPTVDVFFERTCELDAQSARVVRAEPVAEALPAPPLASPPAQ